MAREAHHWVLATVAMLKGHIECLHCSTSHWQCQNHEHSLSHQHAWGADSSQEVGGTLGVEGSIGVMECRQLHWRTQAVGRSALHQAPVQPKHGGSPSKIQVWIPAQKQPSNWQMGLTW